jgi:hypothetical protein
VKTQRWLSYYPALKEVDFEKVDRQQVVKWVEKVAPTGELRDMLVEFNHVPVYDMWVFMAALLWQCRVLDYRAMDVFELHDIVYRTHGEFESFCQVKDKVVVLYTGFCRFTNEVPQEHRRLGDWVCQFWDMRRSHQLRTVLMVDLVEAANSDVGIWEGFVKSRDIQVLENSRGVSPVKTTGGGLYAR